MDITIANFTSMIKKASKDLLPYYALIKKAMPYDDSPVWLNANTPSIGESEKIAYTDSYKVKEALESRGINTAYITERLPDNKNWIFIKKALATWEVTHPIAQTMALAPAAWNKPLGGFGTSPLFSMLTSGVLGGGLGYLGGTLAEQLVPEEYMEPGKLRKTTALMGALAGAAGPAYLGTIGHRNWTDPNRSPWNSWIEPNVLSGIQKTAMAMALNKLVALNPDKEADVYVKAAFFPGSASGMMGLQQIPVDAFNRVILNDPFMSNGMQMATIGLTTAADQSGGKPGLISPFDIARIGIGMGAGLSEAYLGGKVLGALAGLTPMAQKTLQQTGMFAGAIKAIIPGIFGATKAISNMFNQNDA